MSERFEFQLIGANAPKGELDADHLIALVRGIRDVTLALGRQVLDSSLSGRPSKELERIARVNIGLKAGSTCLTVERRETAGELPLDCECEIETDRKFRELVESIGQDERPAWVSDSVATVTGGLVRALRRAAPTVVFRANGETRASFETTHVNEQTWRPESSSTNDLLPVEFAGRLEKDSLQTFALPSAVPLQPLLESGDQPRLNALGTLTDAESASFFEALGL